MEVKEVEVDKQGRICQGGRPLRNKEKGKQAFHGKPGKPHPRLHKLKARQDAYDNSVGKNPGYKRPGSIKK